MEPTNKIMVVDDNPLDQMITSRVLRANYGDSEIMVMENAIDALAYLESNQDHPAALPALILLDLDMPEVNGFGFVRKFAALPATVKNACKIVVLTASEQLEDLALMETEPFVAKLIPKPLRKNALVQMI